MKKTWKQRFLCALLAASMLCMAGCSKEREISTSNSETSKQQESTAVSGNTVSAENNTAAVTAKEIDLGGDVFITEVKSFAGMYFEDGSDEIVSNVMMLMVENRGEENIQLADITAYDAAGNAYTFRITTLLPGSKVTVLEANRAEYSADKAIVSAEVTNLALFAKAPEMHEDVLEFTCSDHMVKVKNISGSSFAGGRVCYKNASGDIYIGGITYSLTIPALESGEETTLYATHFTEGASKLAFVSYAG